MIGIIIIIIIIIINTLFLGKIKTIFSDFFLIVVLEADKLQKLLISEPFLHFSCLSFTSFLKVYHQFYRAAVTYKDGTCTLSAGLSVCPSVRPSHWCTVSK